jgi:hypothetical protein
MTRADDKDASPHKHNEPISWAAAREVDKVLSKPTAYQFEISTM